MEFSPSIIAALGTAIVSAIVFSYFKLTDKSLRNALEADYSARVEAGRVLEEQAKAAENERWQRHDSATAAQTERMERVAIGLAEAAARVEAAAQKSNAPIPSTTGIKAGNIPGLSMADLISPVAFAGGFQGLKVNTFAGGELPLSAYIGSDEADAEARRRFKARVARAGRKFAQPDIVSTNEEEISSTTSLTPPVRQR